MRIWSLHPSYLDSKGLVALWRETLLARKVLRGLTKGYTKHPQLLRFKELISSVAHIDSYLSVVHAESSQRGYNFDSSKFEAIEEKYSLNVTYGQLKYEWEHLLQKLKVRDPEKYKKLATLPFEEVRTHPLFKVIPGDIESWEIVQTKGPKKSKSSK